MLLPYVNGVIIPIIMYRDSRVVTEYTHETTTFRAKEESYMSVEF